MKDRRRQKPKNGNPNRPKNTRDANVATLISRSKMGPWDWHVTAIPGNAVHKSARPASEQDMAGVIIAESECLLAEAGISDWRLGLPDERKALSHRKMGEVIKIAETTPDVHLALEARQAAHYFVESGYKSAYWALMAGRAYGEMLAAYIWRTKLAKGGRKQIAGKREEKEHRQNLLRDFIIQNGDVPPLGTAGQQNPKRTRYFQRFQKAFGKTVSIDTFNRDVKEVCAKQD